jgi:hypothetical protein
MQKREGVSNKYVKQTERERKTMGICVQWKCIDQKGGEGGHIA